MGHKKKILAWPSSCVTTANKSEMYTERYADWLHNRPNEHIRKVGSRGHSSSRSSYAAPDVGATAYLKAVGTDPSMRRQENAPTDASSESFAARGVKGHVFPRVPCTSNACIKRKKNKTNCMKCCECVRCRVASLIL